MLVATGEDTEIMRCLNCNCEKQYGKGRCINVCNAVDCDKKITEETIKQKIQKIADTYGYDTQSRQCIEEMAELTQAINKFWRKQLKCGLFTMENVIKTEEDFKNLSKLKEEKGYQNLIEEIADVQIMLWQMQYLLNADVMPIIEQKIERQLERIERNE